MQDIYEKQNDICFMQSELWLEMLFLIEGSNCIIYDCERIIFVIFKDRRLTKMTLKTF